MIDGKLGSRAIAAGILAIHQRDSMQLMNNSVMETTSAHLPQDLFALETMIITYLNT